MLVGLAMVGFAGFKHFMASQNSENLVNNKITHKQNLPTISGNRNFNNFPFHPAQVPPKLD